MRGRVLRIGLLVVALFAINAAARLVARFSFGDGTAEHLAAQDRLSWGGWGAMALLLAVTAAWWVRRRPVGEVAGELGAAAALAGLLYVAVGPFFSEPPRFDEGISGAIVQLAVYLLVAFLGVLVGMLVMIAGGLDHKSRLLKDYAKSRSTRPRRPVRG